LPAKSSARASTASWCPADDPDTLASTLERVLRDPDLRAKLGAEARQTYERYLDSSRYGSDVVGLFKQVLDRPY
jgi:glycosyltransferase involved in cell wall biosynthesis